MMILGRLPTIPLRSGADSRLLLAEAAREVETGELEEAGEAAGVVAAGLVLATTRTRLPFEIGPKLGGDNVGDSASVSFNAGSTWTTSGPAAFPCGPVISLQSEMIISV